MSVIAKPLKDTAAKINVTKWEWSDDTRLSSVIGEMVTDALRAQLCETTDWHGDTIAVEFPWQWALLPKSCPEHIEGVDPLTIALHLPFGNTDDNLPVMVVSLTDLLDDVLEGNDFLTPQSRELNLKFADALDAAAAKFRRDLDALPDGDE